MALNIILPAHVQRLLGPPPGGDPGEGGVLLDAVLEEAVEHKATVTQYPVELGAEITDHVILEPMRYKMTGIITDTPLIYAGTEYTHSDASTRSSAAWALLADLMAARTPFSIDTGWLRYDDMVIDSLLSEKVVGLTNAVEFEASLRQLNIVSTKTTDAELRVRAEGQAQGANGPEKGGTVKKTDIESGSTLAETIRQGLRSAAGL